MARTKVFISYSHEDEEWKHRVSSHVRVLKEQGLLELWCDRDIEIGADWEKEIDTNLATAKIAVLLISANYLASKFVMTKEVPHLLAQHEAAGMRIIPVLMKDCVWEAVPWLKRLQMLPRDSKPVTGLPEARIDGALADVAREIFQIVGSGEQNPSLLS